MTRTVASLRATRSTLSSRLSEPGSWNTSALARMDGGAVVDSGRIRTFSSGMPMLPCSVDMVGGAHHHEGQHLGRPGVAPCQRLGGVVLQRFTRAHHMPYV